MNYHKTQWSLNHCEISTPPYRQNGSSSYDFYHSLNVYGVAWDVGARKEMDCVVSMTISRTLCPRELAADNLDGFLSILVNKRFKDSLHTIE